MAAGMAGQVSVEERQTGLGERIGASDNQLIEGTLVTMPDAADPYGPSRASGTTAMPSWSR
jgi:hypothetical protein